MKRFRPILFLLLLLLSSSSLWARIDKVRASWRDDPSTTMVIGWNQATGNNPIMYLGTEDHGKEFSRYSFSTKPDHKVGCKGMLNHFVRLTNLRPNTVYYFVIKDSDDISKRYSFQTIPNSPDDRLSIIAGGDSRNNPEARLEANQLVAKLRPHFVLFSGDMTDRDNNEEWREWMDDWQKTISKDGHITPIVVARGNHEEENSTLVNLFDLRAPDVYYALNFGGNLLRVYTLNSVMSTLGDQTNWLAGDLYTNRNKTWKFAQYHNTIRPHTARKDEMHKLYNWAKLFYENGVNVAIESDAHVVKSTWPIKPSNGPRSHEGFARDDRKGTVYIGEGGWGAPLRVCNDNKPWTRASGSFNQFKWIFVDKYKIEIRTVKTKGSAYVHDINPNDRFSEPYGLDVWEPSTGKVITISKTGSVEPQDAPGFNDELLTNRGVSVEEFAAKNNGPSIMVSWNTGQEPRGMIYEVQRSLDDGRTYKSVVDITGKGQASNSYEFMDLNLSSNAQSRAVKYRLVLHYPNGKPVEMMHSELKSEPSPSEPVDNSLPDTEDLSTWDQYNRISVDASGRVQVAYKLDYRANIVIRLINPGMREVSRLDLPNQPPGRHLKGLDMNRVPSGRYLLTVRANGKPIMRFRVLKR